eukprot:GDKJ01059327.1.p1 GENE.GDKJ01059327.1~~GDKJ01059327.1.p1  ORF type:complete len:125 (+),score=13.89 GDKJ01059327.1:31-405(+)
MSRSTSSETKVKKKSKHGLVFPVGRIGRFLREGRYAKRISAVAPLVMTSILEYVCFEFLWLSAQCCLDDSKTRITPRHIQFAIHSDDELSKLLAGVAISSGGVIPTPDHLLIPSKKGKWDGNSY